MNLIAKGMSQKQICKGPQSHGNSEENQQILPGGQEARTPASSSFVFGNRTAVDGKKKQIGEIS